MTADEKTTGVSGSGSSASGLGSLLKHLPTGTVFAYEFLSPVLSNNGSCSHFNKILTAVLIGCCGLTCALSCFTDSYTDGKKTYYGVATTKGLWTSSSKEKRNDPRYKLGPGDFVHAMLSAMVFAVVAVLDSNTVACYFPVALRSSENTFVASLPVVVGSVASLVFTFFPSKRHGIGYPKPENTYINPPSSSSSQETGKV
ncbi:hypothetical protein Nepgr_010175 [Nepenthes gracilis]|uniref:Uncharacterized protein n=1 Tax=Nepenthes gracilis TaxID=150966 RepID=A0AAD3SCK7_NEPGR|nr:hypothetical protein Nepgr_010175 [Nepenthes gracilis]